MASNENGESSLRLHQTGEAQETSETNETDEDEGPAPSSPQEQVANPRPASQLDQESLQAMTRSWWGGDEDGDEESAPVQQPPHSDENGGAVALMEQDGVVPQSSTLSTNDENVVPPLSNDTQENIQSRASSLIPDENLKDAYRRLPARAPRDRTSLLDIDDDDPSLHPPVAAMPRQQVDVEDEKAAYRRPRRQTSPVSARRLFATAGHDASNASTREPQLHVHRQSNLDPRPGAIPMHGRGAGQAPDWAGNQPESPPQQPVRRQRRVMSDFNLAFHRNNASSIQNADITEANAINDAEAVVYATSVNPDNTAKNRRIVIGLGIMAVAIIVGLSVGLVSKSVPPTSQDDFLDPWCLLPAEEQDVFARCVCSSNNTTDESSLDTQRDYILR